MIVKKKWNELVTENSISSLVIDNNTIALATALDTAINTKYSLSSQVENLVKHIKNDFLTASQDGVWYEMPIYTSSFKEKDKRVLYGLNDRLNKYLRFFTKMVTDDGLARQMSIDRGFENHGGESDTNKSYNSDTPQEELDNFETALIKYASSLSKDQRSRTSNQHGTSYERAKNTSWDEGMKNLRLVFYNDLVEFISAIPNIIYTEYCLDSRPYPALVKEYRKNLINTFGLDYAR